MSGFNLSAPKQQSVNNVPPVQPGPHVAILVRMVDLGRQYTTYKGEGKWTPKLQLVFELPFNTHVFKEGEEAKPKWIYANFTFVISDNSHLKKFIDGVIGRPLRKEEYTYNVGELLGKAFIIQVTNTPKNDGSGVWENISSASLVTEQTKSIYTVDWNKVIAKNDIWGFAIDNAGSCFKSERFGDFGDRMREKLLKSEQGISFIESGGVPYVKKDVGMAQPVQPLEAVTNPLANTVAPVQPVSPVQPIAPEQAFQPSDQSAPSNDSPQEKEPLSVGRDEFLKEMNKPTEAEKPVDNGFANPASFI